MADEYGLDKITAAVSNNKDWAAKAYEIDNQVSQIDNQRKQVEVQQKAQQLNMGERLADKMNQVALLPPGPLRKANIKALQGLGNQLGTPISPETLAALEDPSAREVLIQSLNKLQGMKGTPQGDGYFAGLVGLVSSDKLVDTARALNNQDLKLQLGAQQKIARENASVLKQDQTTFKNVESLSNRFNALRKDVDVFREGAERVKALAATQGNKFSDAALTGLNQVLSEGGPSALKDNDIQRYGGGSGLLDQVRSAQQKAQNGTQYTATDRKALNQFANIMSQFANDQLKRRAASIYNQAKSNNLPLDEIMGNDAVLFEEGAQAGAQAQSRSDNMQQAAPVSRAAPVAAAIQFDANKIQAAANLLKAGTIDEAGLRARGVDQAQINAIKKAAGVK